MTEEGSPESDESSRVRGFMRDQLVVLQEHLGAGGHCDMRAVLGAAQQIAGMASAVLMGEVSRYDDLGRKTGENDAS